MDALVDARMQYDVVDRLTGAAFRPPDDNDYNDTGKRM